MGAGQIRLGCVPDNALAREKAGRHMVAACCIVGLEGMTPQQSFQLAEPRARKFDAQTNAERGQGLVSNAVQAWASIGESRGVYVAAYKTWEVLDSRGAAARLLYVQR